MSNCTVTIKINGLNLTMNLKDSSPSVLIDESLIEALRLNPSTLKTIIDGIRELSINSGIRSTKLEDLKIKGILANCTLSYLRDNPEFRDIDFPNGNANILLVNNLEIDGKSIYGRTIDSNGEEVFIVKGTTNDLKKLAYFLKIRNMIRDYGLDISDESIYYNELNEIVLQIKQRKNKEEINNIENMLIDYMTNKKTYSGIFLNNGKSAIQIVESFIRNLKDYDKILEYEDPFITDFNFRKFYKGKGEIFISNLDLYKILKLYYKPLINTIGLTSQKAFESISSDETLNITNSILKYILEKQEITEDNKLEVEQNIKDTKELLEGSKNGYDAILRFVLSTEPDFTYSYKYNTKKGITLKLDYTPISEKYGIAYNTILNMSRESYRGYTIYTEILPNKKKRYYISRGTLVEASLSNLYTSKKAAKEKIDKDISKLILSKNSLVEFKYRDKAIGDNEEVYWDNSLSSEIIKSDTHFITGLIIESINIPIDRKTNIRGDELVLFNKTLLDFYNLVESWNINGKNEIINKIDTPEKAITYIYKINELLGMEDRTDSELLVNIANIIANSDYNYYYIENSKYLRKYNEYKVIPTDKDKLLEYLKNQSAPIGIWMSAISNALYNQFGVTVNLVTSEEVVNDLKGVADPNIDKAFIYNGEIYVNTSIASTNDLLHEHIHLILGILKSNPELRSNYEKLLKLIINTTEGNNLLKILKERYSNLSLMDLYEEVFAKLFSNYIRNRTTILTSLVFTATEGQLKRLTESIFNTNISDIKSFYGNNMTSIFEKFNKEVAKLLLLPDIDFGSTKNSRKISNWISKQIKEGNIIENC